MSEVHEDIFYSENYSFVASDNESFDFEKSASMLVLLVKVDEKSGRIFNT